MKRWWTCVCMAALLALPIGCGDDEREYDYEDGDGSVSVKHDGQTVVIRQKDGAGETQFSAGGDLSVPAGFPDDVLVYPGGKLTASHVDDGTYVLNFQSDDTAAEVLSAYGKKMAESGWTEASNMRIGEQHMIGFEKDGREASLLVTEGENTDVHLSVKAAEEQSAE